MLTVSRVNSSWSCCVSDTTSPAAPRRLRPRACTLAAVAAAAAAAVAPCKQWARSSLDVLLDAAAAITGVTSIGKVNAAGRCASGSGM
jgi:hypothetical protein